MPTPRLQDKVAIITGGASGFGAGIVRKFVSEGCRVLIWDINPTLSSEAKSWEASGKISLFEGDVSKPSDWTAALQQCIQTFGTLDILVNNAGVVHVARPSHEVDEDEVDRMWRVNVKPLYYSASVMVPYWRSKDRGGVVVNLSSISAVRPRPGVVWYAASKGGVSAVSMIYAHHFIERMVLVGQGKKLMRNNRLRAV
ncbi:hypothetical protein N0V90_000399 [Kalmusia sp. IMI 367209]|nr:hypothetical protein N0V90_000399 [Kalmusia sp. IMI 367209]